MTPPMPRVSLFLAASLLLTWAPAALTAPWKVRKIAAGHYHACAILTENAVKCWGENAHGQLGVGDLEDRGDEPGEMGNALPFVDLDTDLRIRELALGRDHSCALFGANFVKCWGSNEYGQLGLGDTIDRGGMSDDMGNALPLVRISEDQTITSLTAGSEHTCALLSDGSVRCWGRNHFGQLGLGHTDNFADDWEELIPDANVDLGAGRTAVQIDAGYAHTCALLDDATIKCWGLNEHGQLGIGSTFNRGDSALEMAHYLQEVDFGIIPGTPIYVGSGGNHSCALFDNGYVRCWGEGRYGLMGIGNEEDIQDEADDYIVNAQVDWGMVPNAMLTVGGFHNCAKGTGGIACWGMNLMGQLGNGRSDGESVGDDYFDMGIFLDHTDLGDAAVTQMESGWHFTCARILFVDRVKCWGWNAHGELGLGDTVDRGELAEQMGDALPYVDLGGDGKR
jgi:E3 ubiquitin-protein ligase HERC3